MNEDKLFVSVYPNPCRDFVSVHAPGCLLSLYNSLGQKLREERLTENQSLINMVNYPQGIYVIHLRNSQAMKYIKIIKQ
jgi:hypothetical protein